MATVKISQSTRDSIVDALNDNDIRKVRGRRQATYIEWQRDVRPVMEYLTQMMASMGKPMASEFIESAQHAVIASVNGCPLDYQWPGDVSYPSKAMLVGYTPKLEQKELMGNYLYADGIRTHAGSDYTHDESQLEQWTPVDELPSRGPDYALHRAIGVDTICDQISGARVLPMVACNIPLPAGPTSRQWLESARPMKHNAAIQAALANSLTAECEDIRLLGMITVPDTSYDRKVFASLTHYILDINLPHEKAEWVHGMLKSGAEAVASVGQDMTSSSFTRKIISLLDEYSTVNALVRDIPALFQLLPDNIQTRLRQETAKRTKRGPVLTAEEKQALAREALLNTFE